jgi:autotransporter-associated beta strand protein
MKPLFRNSFAVAIFAVATLTASSYAQTTLLADDFNSETSFTANPNADQTGTLAGASYTVASLFGTNSSVRGAGLLEISPGKEAGDRVIVNADYITYANTNDTAIQFSFTYDASSADWVGFSVGTDSAWMSSSGELNALFTNSGTSAAWINGVAQTAPTTFSYPQTITVELRGTAGGSAFDGGGSVAEIWAGSTSIATYTLEQLNATNGKFAFNSYNGSSGAGGTVDNFSITAASSNPQTTLLADDFTVTGTTNSADINFNLAPRQTGTQAPQSWTGSNNAQAGNDFFALGDANYLLVADADGKVTLSGMNLASLVATNEKLVISFDIRADAGGYGWTSFTLGNLSSGVGTSQPNTAATEFAFLYQNDTGVQVWDNGTNILFEASTSGGNNFTFTFTDAATQTGSPFGVNAKVTVMNGANTIGTYDLNGGLSADTYITFGMPQSVTGGRGGIDNLAVTTVAKLGPTGTWNTTTNGALWTLNTNWVGNVIADGTGKTADFNHVNLTADTAVGLNGNRTIGNLIFGDTNTATGGWWSLNGPGVLTLAGGSPTITVNALAGGSGVGLNAALAGTSGFTKNGTGTLILTGGTSNTLSGPITVSAGMLGLQDSASLQNMTGAITVASGATFDAKAGFGAGIANNFILSGTGTGYYGALNIRENASLNGAITLAADTLITHDWNIAYVNASITGNNTNLELKTLVNSQYGFFMGGPISLGTGSLTLNGIGTTGSADFTLYGANSWGAMVIEKGVVVFNNTAAMGGTGANITIGTDGVAILNGAPISTLLSRVNTASTGAIAFSSSSSDNIDLTNHPSLSVGSQVNMVLSGTITSGGGFYRLGGGGKTLTVSSTLSGSSGLVVNDTQGGTLVLSGGHTYTGSTTVTAGTLQVDGSLSGAVSVAAAGTLAPGPASAIGSLTLASPLTANGKLSFRIDRSNSQKADLITAPSLALTGVLSVNNIGPALQAGDSFKLFDISGSFTQSQVTFSLPTLSPGLTWDVGSLLTTGTLNVAAMTNTIGDPNWPQLLSSQLQAVRDAGYSSVTINPGTYQMPDAGSSIFQLNSWSNFTINATGVLFTVGHQHAFVFENCTNVTLRGAVIRSRNNPFTQGRVLEKGNDNDGSAYAIWRISDGYADTFSWWFNAVDQSTRKIDINTGDLYYNSADATYQGDRKWKLRFPGRTSLPFQVNDWLVARSGGQPPAVFLSNSRDCTVQSVTSQSGAYATFREIGGGGNRILNCRIEPTPEAPAGGTELPVVSCAADGIHSAIAYPGPHIEEFVTEGVMLDDCIAIRGTYATISEVAGNTLVMDWSGMCVVNDPVRISSTNGFFAQATCTAIVNLSDGRVRITLDQTLAVPAGAKASNPKFNGSGFRIINCQLGNTRSRGIITKADDGLISGCTIRQSGIAINIGPEYYWNESDYCWNNTVVGNLISDCVVGVNLVQGGAIGNRNFSVIDNSFSQINGGNCIYIGGCDGATISGNSFPTPTAAETIRLDNSTNITMANNLVAYAPGGIGVLNIGSNVTSVQGAANGMLYSGRAYALSNSLSGLLLAHPSSNAVGTTLQQYSNGNPSSRWILQPDGNGHCKIVSATGLVVGVNESSSSAAPLILETSGPGQGQRWTLTPVGTSAIKLVNQLSGFAATVQTASLAETVTQLADTSAVGQLWTPAQDDPPVAAAQDVTTLEDTAKPITLAGTDLQGSPLTYSIVNQPAGGTLSGTPPNLTYTPTANFNGTDGFTFKVNDGSLDSPPATVSITVTPVNDVPVFAVNPFATAGATESLAYAGQTLAGRATDADAGDTVTYSKVSGPAWLAVAPNGTLSGTPPTGSAGLNTFSVRATDSAAATADATLQITVTAQPLPLPWLKRDIGTGMLAGSVTYNAGTFTQAGSGTIGSTSDKFNFAYQTLTGDGEIRARISVLQDTGSASRVGVMIRDTLAANSKQIFMGMTSTNAYRWVRRTTTGGTATSSNSSTGTVPNTWVRLVRSGTTITAYKSTNGTTWTTVGSTTGTTFASTCYIGLAVSSGTTTTLNTSQFSNVTVTP